MSASETPTWQRMVVWILWIAAGLAVVALLFEVVFPWFEVNYYNPTIS